MSQRGYIHLGRAVFDHPIFAPEPFTEREAWMWLICEAAWKPKRIRAPHGMVTVERGQVAHSQRFLATKWRWDRSRVRRFLALLESEEMVTQLRPSFDPASTQQKAHETTQLTICNYDKYQPGGPSDEPSNEIENEQETNQDRPKDKEINTKKEIMGMVSKPSRKKPARPMPDIFPMSETHRQYAERRGYRYETPVSFANLKAKPGPAQEMFEAFKNHHTAKGSLFADWDAAWRTWVDNQAKWDAQRGRAPALRPAL